MSIRIGGGAIFSLDMITPESRVEETRRYLLNPTQWYEISKRCIAEKKFLILTICIGFSDKLEYMPDENQWRNIIEDSTVKLLSVGGNRHNCRVDIINEPMKYISKEKYAWFINVANNQVRNRLKVGAGCEEFITAHFAGNMYEHICINANFDVLVIHIQGSCPNEEETERWTSWVKDLADDYNLEVDCNEANYSNVATSKGFERLKMQMRYAEKIGCSNFPVVFLNLDQSAFSVNTDKWTFLSFKVNGKLRSPYWNDFVNIINTKAPIPNLVEPIIISEDDDMELRLLGLSYTRMGQQVKWLQDILLNDYKVPNSGGIDGKLGTITDKQIRDWQEEKELKVDGIVGEQTTMKLINESSDPRKWFINLQIYMSYE